MFYTASEGLLYLLAIVLASYAVWEKLPDGKSAKNLAFAGALLTLFLTFFLTSLEIDEMREQIIGLKTRVESNENLAMLDRSTSSQGRAADLLVGELLTRLSRMDRELRLTEGEGIDLLSKMLTLESASHPEELRIIAVSIDPNEFQKPRASGIYGYETSIAKVAAKGHVERVYLLNEEEWNRVKQHKDWFRSDPWTVPAFPSDSLLKRIEEHHRDLVYCYLVGPAALSQWPNKSDLDIIILSRAPKEKPEEFIFSANRSDDGDISIIFGEDKRNNEFIEKYRTVRDWGERIEIPRYVGPQKRPADNR